MSYRIAICDDCAADGELIVSIVKEWAQENRLEEPQTELFSSAEAFLFRYSEDKCWDILLLDIEMGQMDGVTMADALGQPHELVYKTLVTVAKSKEHYVFVIPIEAELDLKKAARAVHEKSIEMLPLKELTDLTGYVRGGCTCIGMKKQFPVVMDESARSLPKVMVSGGRRGSQMELSPEDLMRAAGGSFADVTAE